MGNASKREYISIWERRQKEDGERERYERYDFFQNLLININLN